ncbi:MAG: NlpC/P60 family protein [Candidatus Limnocylindrales bacterium]
MLFASILAGLLVGAAAPVAADETTPTTQFDRVFATAKEHLGARWVHYAKGPEVFDCVGYVFFIYNENGLKDLIGGYRGVKAYFNWFRDRGLASTTNPQPGDLIIWGRYKHIGMYLGPDQAISALINPYGVSVHPIRKSWIGMAVKAYLHVPGLER